MTDSRKQITEITVLLLRIAAGLMFLQVGGKILFGWFGGMPPDGATAELMSQAGIGGILEFAGGILMVVGLFTRPVAFILSGEMAVAYWQFHFPHGNWPVQNDGEPAVLFCFIFLFFSAYGASRRIIFLYYFLLISGGYNDCGSIFFILFPSLLFLFIKIISLYYFAEHTYQRHAKTMVHVHASIKNNSLYS